jgi:hypothetical protein
VLVTDFWYTRISIRTQVVTGLTRNGVWLVRQPRRRPLTNLQFPMFVTPVRAVSGSGWAGAAQLGLGLDLPGRRHLGSWNFPAARGLSAQSGDDDLDFGLRRAD